MKLYFKNNLTKALLASSVLGMLPTVANAAPLTTINVDTTATAVNTGFEFITPLCGNPITLTVPDVMGPPANTINTGTLSGPTLYSIMQDSTAPGSTLLFPGLGIFANDVMGPVGVAGVQGTTGGLTTAISYIHLTAEDLDHKPTVIFHSTVNAESIRVEDGNINFEDDLTADSFVMNAGGASFNGTGPTSQKIQITNGIISSDSLNFSAVNGAIVEGVVEDPNAIPTLLISINKDTTFNDNVRANTIQFSNDATVTFLGDMNADIESRFSPPSHPHSYGTILFNNIDSPVSIFQNIGANANQYLKSMSILSGANLVFNNNTIYKVGDPTLNVGGTSVMGTLTIASNQSMKTFLDVKSAGTLNIAKGTTLELTSMNLGSGAFLLETGGIFTVDLSGTPGILDFPDLNNTRQLRIESGSVITILNPSVQSSADYPLMTNFNLLQNDGAVITGGNNLFTRYELSVTGNAPHQDLNLVVTVAPVTTYANENNGGVAGALENIRAIPLTGTLALQEAQLFNGSIQSTEQYNDNLQTVAPVVDGGIVSGGFNLMNQIFSTANDRMDYLRVASKHSAPTGYMAGDAEIPIENTWIKILGQHGHQGERDGIAGYTDRSWGLSAGLDVLLCEKQVLGIGGVAFSWSTLDVHNLLSGSTTEVNSYQGTLYGAMDFNSSWYLDGLVTMAYNDYDGSRQVTLGALQYAPQAAYDGWQWGAKIASGYDYQTGSCWHTIPSLSLTYAHLEIEAYTETGANTANQTINQQNYDMLLASATLEFAYDYYVSNNIRLQPEIHFQLFYDFIDDAMQTTSQFTGAGPSFSTQGAKPARWSYDIGLSVMSFKMYSGLSLALSYDYNFKEDYQANAGFARLNYQW